MSEYPNQQEVRKLSSQEGSKVLVVGNRVYDASQLIPSVVHFTRKQYLFLQSYRLGIPLEEAAHKAGMMPEEADHFLDMPKTVAWLEDRATKDYIRNEWAEGGKWWEMGNDVLEGKKHLAKDQQVVFMAFGDRVCPKAKEVSEGNKTTINFNFTAKDVQDAFKRQASIDAEIAQ